MEEVNMAINYPQFPKLNAADLGGLGGFDLGEAIRSGLGNYNLYQEAKFKPRNLENEAHGKELMNKIKEAQAKYAEPMESAGLQLKQGQVGLLPLRQKLLEAQTHRQEQLSNQPYGGMLSGIAKEAYGISQLTGEDPSQVAKKLYQNKLEQASALNQYRQALTSTAGKRASTQLGKLEQEEQEVAQGFEPGSAGTVKLDPEQQQNLLGQYQLARQKLSSDVDTRKKLLYATNLDKTLNNINVDNLTQFSGVAGGIVKKMQQGKSLSGYEEKSYEDYQKALTGAKLLAKQVRQFYGDSITPAIQEQLSELTNPESWSLNPKLAKAKFNQFKSILESETKTYRDALKGSNVYKNAPESLEQNQQELNFNPQTGRLE